MLLFARSIRQSAAIAILSAAVPVASAASLTLNNSMIYSPDDPAYGWYHEGGNATFLDAGSNGFGNFWSRQGPVDSGRTYNFYDDFVFLVGEGGPTSVSARLNAGGIEGLTNVQVRFFRAYTLNMPIFGMPVGGEIQTWSAPMDYDDPSAPTWLTILPQQDMLPGAYVLEVRGNATDEFSGFYSGQVILGEVPLPGGVGLFASGLVALTGVSRQRKAKSMV